MKKRYYYTSDANDTYSVLVEGHLAHVAGLQEIPKGEKLPLDCNSILNNPRYIWAKEAEPASPTHTKRIKLIVQANSPLYKTNSRQNISINGVDFITTGRIGEGMTFETDSQELERELSKPQKAQSSYPARVIKWYSYRGDDDRDYVYSGAEYLAAAAGLKETKERSGKAEVSLNFNCPRYIWVKEAVQYSHGKTRRIQVVVQADSPLYRTNERQPVYIDGILYISTGRVGECQTFS